ncbi:MAG: glycine betaine ABC transporter substrate-binding protein [Acidimicrobiales bacterium]
MKTRKSIWVALITALALVAAACGSESTADTADAPATTAAAAADDAATETTEAMADDSATETTEAMADDAALPGAGVSVNMGRANWSSGYVQAQILHDLMEEMGYEVSSPDGLEFAPDLGYQAMATGDMDFWANSWYPGHLSWWEGELPDGSQVGDNLERLEGSLMPGGGLQGMLVTKAWADAEGFTTLDEINGNPDLWGALDSDGNGKGEFFGCPEDWTCDDIMTAQIAFAGWDNLEQTQAGYDAMFAEFLGKAQAGEPAIIYTWTPTSYLAQAIPGDTTMWLSVNNESVLDDSNPTNKEGGQEYCQRCGDSIGYQGLGADTCLQGPDGCQVGWEAADIEITANKAWLAENPAARGIFEVFKPALIDLAIAGVALAATDGAQADVEGIAAKWITDNRALADEWVAAGLAAAG